MDSGNRRLSSNDGWSATRRLAYKFNRRAANDWSRTQFSAERGCAKPSYLGYVGYKMREPYSQLDVM